MNIKEVIRGIGDYRRDLKNTPMGDLIEGSTNHKVSEFDAEKNKNLLEEIKSLCSFVKELFKDKPITREIYKRDMNKIKVNAFRNNEVGDYCETLMQREFKNNKNSFKIIDEVKKLSAKGYPDLKLKTKQGEVIFIEVKATSKPDIGSARDFFYTPGGNSDKKIDSDGAHLLVGFVTKQIGEGKFNIRGYKIVDVSKIKVSLKPEFNTDNKGIYNLDTIIFQL